MFINKAMGTKLVGSKLDFSRRERHCLPCSMKRRAAITILCLLYLIVVTVVGVLHDHDHGDDGGVLNSHKHCAACLLQLNGVADVPVLVTTVSVRPLEFTVPSIEVVPLDAFFVPSTASRAPPLASA